MGALMTSYEVIRDDAVVKSPSMAFLLHGKRPLFRIEQWDAQRREAGCRTSKAWCLLCLHFSPENQR